MAITTLSSLEFDQDPDHARKSVQVGPVFITDREVPSHVLLSLEAYRNLKANPVSIAELIGMTDAADIEFDPPKAAIALKPAEFT